MREEDDAYEAGTATVTYAPCTVVLPLSESPNVQDRQSKAARDRLTITCRRAGISILYLMSKKYTAWI